MTKLSFAAWAFPPKAYAPVLAYLTYIIVVSLQTILAYQGGHPAPPLVQPPMM